jgi:hypothetical protein
MANLFSSLMGNGAQMPEQRHAMPFALPGMEMNAPNMMQQQMQPMGLGRALMGGVGLLNPRGFDMFGQGRF